MSELSKKKCVPCSAGTTPLKGDALQKMLRLLSEGWKVVDEHHLEKEYRTKDFLQALALTNAFGKIAEEEGHHPVITLTWGKVKLQIWTHKVDGLTESDFILAAKCDALK